MGGAFAGWCGESAGFCDECGVVCKRSGLGCGCKWCGCGCLHQVALGASVGRSGGGCCRIGAWGSLLEEVWAAISGGIRRRSFRTAIAALLGLRRDCHEKAQRDTKKGSGGWSGARGAGEEAGEFWGRGMGWGSRNDVRTLGWEVRGTTLRTAIAALLGLRRDCHEKAQRDTKKGKWGMVRSEGREREAGKSWGRGMGLGSGEPRKGVRALGWECGVGKRTCFPPEGPLGPILGLGGPGSRDGVFAACRFARPLRHCWDCEGIATKRHKETRKREVGDGPERGGRERRQGNFGAEEWAGDLLDPMQPMIAIPHKSGPRGAGFAARCPC